MIFVPLPIAGAYLIEAERMDDERGWFARTWCAQEFAHHGLKDRFVQSSISHNSHRGTLRGMHYQDCPFPEAKLVQCTRGAIFDVLVDLRENSDTYRKWHGERLSADNRRMLYIPEHCAHGFLTLENDTDVQYNMTEFHHPECARILAWNDPEVRIDWPFSPAIMSLRDRDPVPR